jgi:DNA invertase Pin-like site-specific DNA recombinase
MSTKRVVGYVRVSTEKQASEGVSLAAQEAKLRAYCLAMDLDLVAVEVDEGVSAKSLKGRAGLAKALARIDAGEASGLIVTKLDRLTRSVRDLGALVECYFGKHADLLSLADSIDTRTAAGRLVLNVLVSVAQWEREATAERTSDALAHLKAAGVKLGGEALGWARSESRDDEGRRIVEAVEVEVSAIERVFALKAEGLSLRAIAAQLEAEGFATKRGGRWQAETVRKVLARGAA